MLHSALNPFLSFALPFTPCINNVHLQELPREGAQVDCFVSMGEGLSHLQSLLTHLPLDGQFERHISRLQEQFSLSTWKALFHCFLDFNAVFE